MKKNNFKWYWLLLIGSLFILIIVIYMFSLYRVVEWEWADHYSFCNIGDYSDGPDDCYSLKIASAQFTYENHPASYYISYVPASSRYIFKPNYQIHYNNDYYCTEGTLVGTSCQVKKYYCVEGTLVLDTCSVIKYYCNEGDLVGTMCQIKKYYKRKIGYSCAKGELINDRCAICPIGFSYDEKTNKCKKR